MLKIDTVQLRTSLPVTWFKPANFGTEDQRPTIRLSFNRMVFLRLKLSHLLVDDSSGVWECISSTTCFGTPDLRYYFFRFTVLFHTRLQISTCLGSPVSSETVLKIWALNNCFCYQNCIHDLSSSHLTLPKNSRTPRRLRMMEKYTKQNCDYWKHSFVLPISRHLPCMHASRLQPAQAHCSLRVHSASTRASHGTTC